MKTKTFMKQILLLPGILSVYINVSYAQNTWTKKADFGGSARIVAVSFSVGNKGYIGTGSLSTNSGPFVNDFWEYDANTNAWAQKADFGGSTRNNAVGFNIGNKGYIGTGWNAGTGQNNDFWEYDPGTNTWT